MFLLLLFLLTSVTGDGGSRSGGHSPPQIILPPEDTFLTSEGFLEFSCKGTGYPEPTVKWYDARSRQQISELDNKPSSSSSSMGIHINTFLGRLTITEPIPRRVYAVYCNISNSAGWRTSGVVHGGISFIDNEFLIFPIDKTLREGDSALLECKPPHGMPIPTVEWIFNGDSIPFRNRRITVTPDGDLHIKNVHVGDGGKYECRAENLAGRKLSPSAILHVLPKRQFIMIPKDSHAKIGESVSFACQADGGQITWKRGLKEPPIDTSRTLFTGEYLKLSDVQPSDSGTYICVASDGLSVEAVLTVESKPTFSVTPIDQNVTEGDTVVFQCKTSGFPKQNIYWDMPNQVPIFPEDRVSNVYVHPNGDLEITNVRANNSGIYQCIAHSSFGTIYTSAILHVFFRDPSSSSNLYEIPPVIILPPANQTRHVGDRVNLDCEVSKTRDSDGSTGARLSGEVVWLRGSRSTGGLQERLDFTNNHDNRFSLFAGGGLQITSTTLEDTGNYTCVVQTRINNEFIQVNWTASLLVLPSDMYNGMNMDISPPVSRPTGLRAQNTSAHSVTLHWEAPDLHDDSYSQDISYWIEMFHVGTGGWQVIQESWIPTAIRLEPLQPGGIFYFIIRSRWVNGRVGWASALLGPIHTGLYQPKASGFSPPPPPNLVNQAKIIRVKDVQIRDVAAQKANISWNVKSSQQNHKLAGFTLRYRAVGLMRCISELLPHTPPKDAHFCSLANLYDDVNLVKRIQLFEQHLQAASLRDAQGVSIVPQDSPELVKDVPIDGHRATNWNTQLTQLKPFCCYALEVEPYTMYSVYGRVKGRESESVLFLTHEEVPSEPPVISGLQRKTNHSVEVTWTPPPTDSWNGLLSEFTVFAFNAAESDKRELKFNYNEQHGVVGGLKVGEVYHLQIAAVNCRGSSVRSRLLNFSVSAAGVIHETPFKGHSFPPHIDMFPPWIFGAICGVVAWLSLIVFIVLCCLRHKNVSKQHYPTACGGGDPFTFDGDSGRVCKPGDFTIKFKGNNKDTYNLEPLIKPQSTSGSSELECATSNANKLSGSDILKNSIHDNQQNMFPNTTLASSNSSSQGGHPHLFEENLASSPYFNHMPPNTHILPCSLDYHCPPTEVSMFSTSVMDNSGLPLVAPVAHLSSPSFMASDDANSSVTPYATASLINNEIYPDQQASSASTTGHTQRRFGGGFGTSPQYFPPCRSMQQQQQQQQQQQYMSHSSSGTTTGEEDYMAHQQQRPSTHHQQRHHRQQQLFPPGASLMGGGIDDTNKMGEYELCIPLQGTSSVGGSSSNNSSGFHNTQVF